MSLVARIFLDRRDMSDDLRRVLDLLDDDGAQSAGPAGECTPACEHRGAAFHLAERTFGRFARAIRLTGAFDAGASRATLTVGELRVVLPRIQERRGGEIRIAVQAD